MCLPTKNLFFSDGTVDLVHKWQNIVQDANMTYVIVN